MVAGLSGRHLKKHKSISIYNYYYRHEQNH